MIKYLKLFGETIEIKKILLAIILILINLSVAQAKNISATLFVNGKIIDQFEDDDFTMTLKDFSEAKCRINLKNNLDFKFSPRIKIKFSTNYGERFEDKKILTAINPGSSTYLDIEMKNYSVTERKNTSAWLQIWLDGDKLISEDTETEVWQKIMLDGEKNIFNEHYFCVKFDFLIKEEKNF